VSIHRDRRKAGELGAVSGYVCDSDSIQYGLARHAPSGRRGFIDLGSPINELSQLNGLISHRILYCTVHSRRGGPPPIETGNPSGAAISQRNGNSAVLLEGALLTSLIHVQYGPRTVHPVCSARRPESSFTHDYKLTLHSTSMRRLVQSC
jgi:hypothetical protein